MKTLRVLFFVFLLGGILAACTGTLGEVSTRKYVLTTGFEEGNLVYLGVGGDINGLVNPTLHANPGETITVVLVNSGEGEHDVSFPDLKVKTKRVKENGESVSTTFTVPNKAVTFEYYDRCIIYGLSRSDVRSTGWILGLHSSRYFNCDPGNINFGELAWFK